MCQYRGCWKRTPAWCCHYHKAPPEQEVSCLTSSARAVGLSRYCTCTGSSVHPAMNCLCLHYIIGLLYGLGAFAKFRKPAISFVTSVCPSASTTRLPLDGFSRNLKFGVKKICRKIQVSLKYENNNRYFT